MSPLRVLVVGASVAGPSTAYWFAKIGAKVTVIERFPEMRTGGQNIDIRTVGVTVMRRMGDMETRVRKYKAPLDGMSLVNTHGKSYGTIGATGNPDQQSLVSEYEIFRGDLARILYDMTKDNENINYVFNEQVVSLTPQPLPGQDDEYAPLKADFLNGYPSAEYDLVVACDGSTSRTRAIGLGIGLRDYVIPTYTWAAYFSTDTTYVKGTVGQGFSAVGGRFITAGPDLTGRNRITLMVVCPKGDDAALNVFREANKGGDASLKKYLSDLFRDAGWITNDALADMMQADDLYASEIVQVKLPALNKGSFVLTGDAGCAPGPTGAGTSLAIVGPYVLAGEIHRHKGDLKAGLRGYEERMRPILKDLQTIPPLVGTFMAPQTAWGVWVRNTIFSLICWSGIVGFLQKIFASSLGENTDKYGLPVYTWEEKQ